MWEDVGGDCDGEEDPRARESLAAVWLWFRAPLATSGPLCEWSCECPPVSSHKFDRFGMGSGVAGS